MQTIVAETSIPKYPLEIDEKTGNKMLRIEKASCRSIHIKNDFLQPHRKDYYFFAFIKQGSSKHWIDMVPYTLKPNTFYFTVPHQVHLKEEPKPITGAIIGFTEEFLALDENNTLRKLPIIQNPHNGHELSLTKQDVDFLEDLIDKINSEYHAHNTWQRGMLMAYMHVLIIYLSRLYTEQISNSNLLPGKVLLKKYLERIEESYIDEHEVSSYADMLNVSAGHLGEVVKQQSGKSAIAHIHDRLILEAKRLIFHTDQSIKEIAFVLGFEDASYFNRFFKRITGQTPVDYRLQIREMYQ